MTRPLGAKVMLIEEGHDTLVRQVLGCDGSNPAWWVEVHPFVVVDHHKDRNVVCAFSQDPASKVEGAPLFGIKRGECLARYDTWLHCEMALLVPDSVLRDYVTPGPLRVASVFVPRTAGLMRVHFRKLWDEAALKRLAEAFPADPA